MNARGDDERRQNSSLADTHCSVGIALLLIPRPITLRISIFRVFLRLFIDHLVEHGAGNLVVSRNLLHGTLNKFVRCQPPAGKAGIALR
jgi:hypothetical protein